MGARGAEAELSLVTRGAQAELSVVTRGAKAELSLVTRRRGARAPLCYRSSSAPLAVTASDEVLFLLRFIIYFVRILNVRCLSLVYVSLGALESLTAIFLYHEDAISLK